MTSSTTFLQDSTSSAVDTLTSYCEQWEPKGMQEVLQKLDTCGSFEFSESLILQIVIGFVMFGVALGIKTQHFKNLSKNPKLVLIGFTSQFILLPALTFLLIIAMNNLITPTVAFGMILVAACPGGNISNYMSSLAKGNVALSVTLTAIATAGALLFTPLNFTIWGSLYLKFAPAEYSAYLQTLQISPLSMFKAVFIILGIPLSLGMWINHTWPKFAEKVFNPIKNLSMVLFLALVVIIFMKIYNQNQGYVGEFIGFLFLIVLIHNILALSTGYSLGKVFKVGVPTTRTLAIETGIQNSGLGLALLFDPNIFDPSVIEKGQGIVFIAGWWGVWHILSGLALGTLWSRIPYDDKQWWWYYIPGGRRRRMKKAK